MKNYFFVILKYSSTLNKVLFDFREKYQNFSGKGQTPWTLPSYVPAPSV